jgi:ABC-type spermidine/putrescine transport system permease subunit II
MARATGKRAMVTRRRRRDPVSILLAVLGILIFAFLFAPIVVIVIYSFNTGRLLGAWNGFGYTAYINAWESQSVRDSVQVSMVAGILASTSATMLGTIAGVALARWRSKLAVILTALLAFTLVTPEIIDAVSILPWFVYLGHDYGIGPFNNGLVRLVVVHTSVALATVTFIVRARMSGMDPAIEEAASDLYATAWNRFREVTLPLARPAILAGMLMAFTLSLDNTIVSSFVALPGYTSWPVYIFSLVRVSPKPDVAAVSTVMLAFTLAALALVAVVLRRGGEESITEVLAAA